MSLQSLPFEILTQIIQPLIPSTWNGLSAESKTAVLKLCTVCRGLNYVVSRCALRKLGAVAMLSLDRRPDRIETIRWLLLTKAKMEYESQGSSLNIFTDVPHLWLLKLTGFLRVSGATGSGWIPFARSLSPLTTRMPEAWEFYHGPSFTGVAESQVGGKTITAAQLTVALPLASFQGDKEGVNMLLSSGGKPNMCHSVFGKPLYNAAYNNHVHIITLLVKHGGSLQTSGQFGTLIEVACRQGHIETLHYLLDTISVRESKRSFSKALLLACRNGHEEVVRVLLHWVDSMSAVDQTWRELGSHLGFKMIGTRRQIDLNGPIINEGTPLAAAVANGNEAIVRMLAARDDVQQHFGRSRFCPLWLAVKQDHAPISGLLLDRYQLEPNSIIKRDMTLLCAAAGLGSASVVRMLLQRSDIDPNFRAQEKHTTPLALAVLRGHTEVVGLLLEREDIDPNIPARDWRPLERAVRKGHEAIVRLLLMRQDLNPNSHDTPFTPLGAAARLGMKNIVRMLLERPDTDPNLGHPDSGHSPLRLAIIRHWPHIVRQLLQRKDVDPNQPGIHAYMVSESPLRRELERRPFVPVIDAISVGSTDGLRQLLSQENINANEHHRGQTPLIMAVQNRRTDMVRILLEHPSIDINKTLTCESYNDEAHIRTAESTTWSYTPTLVQVNGPGPTPLFIACRKGYLEVVSLLIQHPRINLKMSDDRSRTALWWAAWGGNSEVFTLLLKTCGEYINTSDFEGWTALHVAVNWGHGAIFDILMGCAELDPNAVNQNGWTALHLAVDRGREAIVLKLLKHPKIDITWRNADGQTAMELARWRGFERLAELVQNRGRRLGRVRTTAKIFFSKYSR
ncbi:unnamed protein product [Clonostachys rosea f. rosea IK726]|uniref:Uncharacterized protein n=1 Tax=Clonostachys rosea f. rosea IK726 TaxID=1349383 RepID=A0ACA9U5N1_BIOOC|nr:unnamed protein product [Clonostachys rosea f. rosea IK726]